MTTKHTPGPWYVGSGTYEGRNIYSTASVTDGEGFTYQPVVATAEDDEVACWDANARLIAAANPAVISELLDRLEAAEADALEQARLNGMGSEREAALMAKLEAAEKSDAESLTMYRKARDERDNLRAKIAEMEKQEPVGKFVQHPSNGLWEQDGYGDNPDATPLYALPGAQKQEGAANAALLAAAPDLLEALQMLLEFPNTGPATTTARAAIARATGEKK